MHTTHRAGLLMMVMGILIAFPSALPAYAGEPQAATAAPLAQTRVGSGPIGPGEATDERFVSDDGTGLDTGCTYRADSPLIITLPIGRAIGATENSGRLSNVQTLIDNRVVAATAKLRMLVYDVDYAQGERDDIYFNDVKVGTLNGANGVWQVNEFTVNVRDMLFPQRSPGGVPTPRDNIIRVDIDTTSDGWCTAVDWVELELKALAPLVLIHGISASREAWTNADDLQDQQRLPREPARDYLERLGVPFEWQIDLIPNGTIANNSGQVAAEVLLAARSYGVRTVHLVGHSKGGLDSRGYLAWRYDSSRVKVLSYHTISTPHRGSVLANYLVYRRAHGELAYSTDPDIQRYLENDDLLQTFGRGPQLPGAADLRTSAAAAFNRQARLPAGLRFYSYGADADLDQVGADSDEQAPLDNSEMAAFLSDVPQAANRVARGNLLYRLIRDQATIRVERRVLPLTDIIVGLELLDTPTETPQTNDLVVSTTSSWLGYEPHANVDGDHKNIKDSLMFRRILDNIQDAFPVR